MKKNLTGGNLKWFFQELVDIPEEKYGEYPLWDNFQGRFDLVESIAVLSEDRDFLIIKREELGEWEEVLRFAVQYKKVNEDCWTISDSSGTLKLEETTGHGHYWEMTFTTQKTKG